MTNWTSDELDRIGAAEELQLSSMRRDSTLRSPVTMWVVCVDDEVYVRAYKGRTSPWFRSALTQHGGRIRAGGVDKDVTFVEAGDDNTISDQIDAAYRAKYRRYAPTIVDSIMTRDARAATIRFVPRD